ncbi:hypothetical protein [Thermochromatium tepidum]|uniref:Uncharacterized protein n=1 Tax=Thermochromatium tepidum ATCC 43061 TaxID=316276 RepID=A0A6I6E0M9_THETI|nr:hypothetical protein [Thermochromatium tepidum]QGU33424.1 hypothetical protein E6P07_10820 [Thermochromatium tepidum ATCC 43061]
MRLWLGALALFVSFDLSAAIPATPVMTVYKFNGPLDVPYYDADRFARVGTAAEPAGTLAQGTSLIPCLMIRDGEPLTDRDGTPYVGFEVVVDPRSATPDSTEIFKRALAERKGLQVPNHHCPASVRNVIHVRELYALEKAPFFDPPRSGGRSDSAGGVSELDRIVRAFHDSNECASVNARLTRRRQALERAWETFIARRSDLGSPTMLERAKHLDYAMRTALYEGHLGRGCSAYGACERSIVVLSIRNRALQCQVRQGCRFPGDIQGVASTPSQYNIWDEYLTQISGLTACYLRPDLAEHDNYAKLQAMYAQTVPDAEQILYGGDSGLRAVFPGNSLIELTNTRHYYHAPAMGQCFPNHDRVEYMTGAVARKDGDFALIANTRIEVGIKSGWGYTFKEFLVTQEPDRDVVRVQDSYPGFLVDARKVSLKRPDDCLPYGIPGGCPSLGTGRYRKVPNWLGSGEPVELHCRIADRGETCQGAGTMRAVSVGGTCDKEMRPVARVP